jgi:hypothetical protein
MVLRLVAAVLTWGGRRSKTCFDTQAVGATVSRGCVGISLGMESQELKARSSKRRLSSLPLRVTAGQYSKHCSKTECLTIVEIPEGAVPLVLDPACSDDIANGFFSGFLLKFGE